MESLPQQVIGSLLLLSGLLAGAIAAWLILRHRVRDAEARGRDTAAADNLVLNERLNAASQEIAELNASIASRSTAINEVQERLSATASELAQMTERANRLPALEAECAEERKRSAAFQELLAQVNAENARLTEALNNEQSKVKEKVDLLAKAGEELRNQFKVLAGDVLKESAKDFSAVQKQALGEVLTPFKTKLEEFEKNVQESGKERAVLKEQVGELVRLNTQLSTEANNLTKALKGQSKARGNWGEIVLKRTLEIAGLREGMEYTLQSSFQSESGARQLPDAVIQLPGSRKLIVDSKVSLNGYEEYVNAESDSEADAARKRFLESVRTHLRSLCDKQYHAIPDLPSPDFVLMFMPIEPAFHLAIGDDAGLWEEGWSKSVLLVGPSTLLFVLRTVAYLWQQERQNQNAQEIARIGGRVHDKLVAFVDDLEDIGDRLKQAQNSHESAITKLSGKGGAIRQAHKLGELGAKTSKAFPSRLTGLDAMDGEEEPGGEPAPPALGEPDEPQARRAGTS